MMQNEQIVQAFKELNLTPAQIAEQFPPLTELAVKACLMQFCPEYRDSMEVNVEDNFSVNEAKEAMQTMVRLMKYSEDEHLQFKVAKYIRDDTKGRLDIGKNLKGLGINVNLINQFIVQGRQALVNSKQMKQINGKNETVPSPAPVTEKELIDV